MRAAERRKQIIASAQQVFAQAGLKGARTRQLAEAAGVNQATLFDHFNSKEDLFVAAVLEPLTELLEGARDRARSYSEATTSRDLMPLLHQGMKQNLVGMMEVFPLLSQALFSERELGQKLYREQILPLLKAQAEAMAEVSASKIDPELMQLASFGMFFAVAMDQAMTGEARDLDAVTEQLTELVMFGSAKRKPAQGN